MSMSNKWIMGIALSCVFQVGCVSKVAQQEQYSGFLANYQVCICANICNLAFTLALGLLSILVEPLASLLLAPVLWLPLKLVPLLLWQLPALAISPLPSL